MVVSNDPRQTQNDTVVTTAPMIIVARVDCHISKTVWQTTRPECNADFPEAIQALRVGDDPAGDNGHFSAARVFRQIDAAA